MNVSHSLINSLPSEIHKSFLLYTSLTSFFHQKRIFFNDLFIFHLTHLCSWSRVGLKSLRLEARKFWLVQTFTRFFRRLMWTLLKIELSFLDFFQNPIFGLCTENFLIYIIAARTTVDGYFFMPNSDEFLT